MYWTLWSATYGASDVWATVSHSHAWPTTFLVASCLTEHVTQTSPVYCVWAHSVCQVSLKYASPPFYLMDVVWFGAYSWVRIVDLARCFRQELCVVWWQLLQLPESMTLKVGHTSHCEVTSPQEGRFGTGSGEFSNFGDSSCGIVMNSDDVWQEKSN